MHARFLLVCLMSLATGPQLAGGGAPAPDAGQKGLLALIPRDAVFVLERRGHKAIRPAFLKSNLGKMAQDDAIEQFVRDTRIRVGRLIVKSMFSLDDPREIDRHQKLLHGLLKPFWYEPCAMFVVFGEKDNPRPEMGFLCLTGEYKQECQDALAALMKVGVPPKGKPGRRQDFTYESGAVAWHVVAKGGEEFLLPEDPKERVKTVEGMSLFMTAWAGRTLCVTTGFRAADAISGMLSLTRRRKSILENPSLAVIRKKTALKEWAFRWFIDTKALVGLVPEQDRSSHMWRMLSPLGIFGVEGMGGTGGYADDVFTRRTYIHAPRVTGGLIRMFPRGGSYKKAHAMVPDSATFCLAARLDMEVVTKMFREAATVAAAPRRSGRSKTKPATQPKPKLDKTTAEVLRNIELLAEASDGNVCGFVTELQALMGMMMQTGPPVGAVLGLKDPQKARQAIDALVRLSGAEKGQGVEEGPKPPGGDDAPDKPARPEAYRKVKIRRLGDWTSIALMKDRVILALSDSALKAAIDAARDDTGGFPPNSPGPTLTELAGDGSALFVMDLAAAAKVFWPLLVQLAGKAQQQGEDFPFASVPSTGKLVRLLGPEIAVISQDGEGLMMRSRGKIPFSTKVILLYPFAGFFVFWWMF